MKKKIIALLLSCCVLFSATPAFAVGVVVSGNQIDYQNDQPPIIQNGRTLVPLRSIFEALGLSVSWNANTQTVVGVKSNRTIELKVNSRYAKINSSTVQLDAPATIINNRTMVPIRFIAESLGSKVEWSQANQCVYIDSNIVPISNPRMSDMASFLLNNNYAEISQRYQLVDVSPEDFMKLASVPSGLGGTFPYPGFLKRIDGTDIVLGFIDKQWGIEHNIDLFASHDDIVSINRELRKYPKEGLSAHVRTLSANASDVVAGVGNNFNMAYCSFSTYLGFAYSQSYPGTYYDTAGIPPNRSIQAENALFAVNQTDVRITPETRIGICNYN